MKPSYNPGDIQTSETYIAYIAITLQDLTFASTLPTVF